MDISMQDFQTGLTYIKLSRIKELRGTIFNYYFDIFRFIEKLNNICQLHIEDQIQKSEEILTMSLEK